MVELEIGSRIDDKYEVVERLARGGVGNVYRVRHLHLGEERVIKLLRPDIATREGAAERFQKEAQLASQLKHPRVATLHDYSRLEDGSFYAVWELIPGLDIRGWLARKGVFPAAIATEVAIQALSGLEAIHRANIVHGDLSPENVMITTDSRGLLAVKIIDLGFAKELATGESGAIKPGGKLDYCAPEQVGLVEGVRADHRADLFSLSVVLYEVISGQLPHPRVESRGDLRRRFEAKPTPLSVLDGLASPVSEQLSEAILRGLMFQPQDRFPAASSFREALQAVPEAPRRTGSSSPSPAETPAPSTPSSPTAKPAAATDSGERRHSDTEPTAPVPAAAAPAPSPSAPSADAALGSAEDDPRTTLARIQTREMLDQAIAARQVSLARLTLETLLEMEPDAGDRADFEKRIESLARETERREWVAQRLREGREAVANGDLESARSALEDLEREDDPSASELRSVIEDEQLSRDLGERVQTAKTKIEALLVDNRLPEVEELLQKLIRWGVPNVVVDVYRGRITRARNELARQSQVELIERRFPELVESQQWDQARQMAYDLARAEPQSERPGEMLAQISRLEEAERREGSVEEGASMVAALLEAGRLEEARVALEVLKKLDSTHPLTGHFQRRLADLRAAKD